jgi:hypothetical protein
MFNQHILAAGNHMPEHTIVGLYPARSIADDVCTRLQGEGVAQTDISVGAGDAVHQKRTEPPQPSSGFWELLFGSDLSDDEHKRYSTHLLSGSIAVSVRALSDAERERVIEVMEQFDPIDIQGSDGQSVALQAAAHSSGTDKGNPSREGGGGDRNAKGPNAAIRSCPT